jgi:hypothetical protein
MLDWESARDSYVRQFGQLHRSDAVSAEDLAAMDAAMSSYEAFKAAQAAEPPPRFFMLTFWSPGEVASHVTYATFGAVDGGMGDEAFLTAVTPYPGFKAAVEDLAAGAPQALLPGAVVPCRMRLTSFEGMLVAPADAGTFALGESGGRLRRALRLVPVTPAERLLAAHEPERLLELLRAAGALVADPLRACVVAPAGDGARRANAAALLTDERRRVRRMSEGHERMVALGAPEVILRADEENLAGPLAMLAFLEARVPEIVPDADAPELLEPEAKGERVGAVLRPVLHSSVEPYVGLVPRRVAGVFMAFTRLVLATHPLVSPLLYESAMGEGRRPASDKFSEEFYADMLVHHVESTLGKIMATANERVLAASAREGVEQAQATFARGGGFPWELHVWGVVVPLLCVRAADLGATQGPAVEHALEEAVALAMAVDSEPRLHTGPARTRLARIASRVSKTLYREYAKAVRRTLRERAASG